MSGCSVAVAQCHAGRLRSYRPRGRTWSVILCADWSKEPGRKREVYAASPQTRRVWRLDPPAGGWDVAAVLRTAQRIRGGRRPPALVGFDAPIGLPASFVDVSGSRSFLGWLLHRRDPDAFEPCRDVEEWSVKRPFFGVPKGKGSLAAFAARIHQEGVEPLREIEKRTHAKSVFITSGIPGSVGSSAIDLWCGLSQFRRHVAVWPFDGPLAVLRRGTRPVVAEIYPRVAYALAISRDPAKVRAPLSVAKGRPEERDAFLAQMLSAKSWVREWAVDLRNLDEAKAREDAFDALVAASGLLRCVLERSPLSDRQLEDTCAEGGILGSGSVRLDLSEKPFQPDGGRQASVRWST